MRNLQDEKMRPFQAGEVLICVKPFRVPHTLFQPGDIVTVVSGAIKTGKTWCESSARIDNYTSVSVITLAGDIVDDVYNQTACLIRVEDANVQ